MVLDGWGGGRCTEGAIIRTKNMHACEKEYVNVQNCTKANIIVSPTKWLYIFVFVLESFVIKYALRRSLADGRYLLNTTVIISKDGKIYFVYRVFGHILITYYACLSRTRVWTTNSPDLRFLFSKED